MHNKLISVAEDTAEGGFFLFTGNVLSTLILGLSTIIVARLLGPEVYGSYSVVLIVPGLLTLFLDWGINLALIKFSAQFCEDGKGWLVAQLIKTGLLFNLISSLVMFIATFLFSDFFAAYLLRRPELSFFIRLVSFVLVSQSIFITSANVFVGLGKMKHNAFILVLQAASKALTSLILVFLGFSLLGAVTGHVLSYLASGLAGVSILLLKHYKSLNNPGENISSFNSLKMMVGYGLPLYISSLVISFLGQYKGLLMVQLVSDAEIGNYRTATNFLTLLAILSTPMATALFPAFSKFNIEKEGKELQNLFRMAVKYTSLLVIPATALTMFLSKDLVGTLYGSQYAMAPFFLTISAVTSLFSGLGSIALGSFFNGVGETKLTFRMRLINVIIFMPLSLPLVSYLRIPGLIISSLISSLTSILYGLFMANRRLNVSINLWASIKIYIASFLSLIPTHLILTLLMLPRSIYNVFLGGGIFLLSFLILAPLIEAIDISDLKALNMILGQVKYVGYIFKALLRFEERILSFAILK